MSDPKLSETNLAGTNLAGTNLPGTRRRSGWIVSLLLLAALVALFVVPLLVAPAPADGGESFGGADAQAVTMVEEQGYEPWFSPVFEPSGEVESGLFALQAALGAGTVGYVIGRLQGRRTRS